MQFKIWSVNNLSRKAATKLSYYALGYYQTQYIAVIVIKKTVEGQTVTRKIWLVAQQL